jgi:hypothetical protein
VTNHVSAPERDDATRLVDCPLGALEWYATEVPSIVTDLHASRTISTPTARAAWRLIDEGSYDRALALALDEAV